MDTSQKFLIQNHGDIPQKLDSHRMTRVFPRSSEPPDSQIRRTLLQKYIINRKVEILSYMNFPIQRLSSESDNPNPIPMNPRIKVGHRSLFNYFKSINHWKCLLKKTQTRPIIFSEINIKTIIDNYTELLLNNLRCIRIPIKSRANEAKQERLYGRPIQKK